MKQHSEHRGVKIYTDAKGHFASKFGEHLTLLKCIEKIDHRLDYKPKNNWVWNNGTNQNLTNEQIGEIEQDYNFTGQTINVNSIQWDLNDRVVCLFEFMGVRAFRQQEASSESLAHVNRGDEDLAMFEELKRVFAEDTMNDIFENHKEYLPKNL